LSLATREDARHLLLIGLARLCPWAFVSPTGHARLARLLGAIDHRRQRALRRGIAAHIAAALGPGAPPAEVDRLTRELFRNRAANDEIFCIESFSRSAARRRSACAGVSITGLDHLRAALDRGRGAILWESWLGHRTLARLVLIELGFRLIQVTGPTHPASSSWLGQRVIRPMQLRAAARLFAEVVIIQDGSVAYLRRLAGRLRDNGIVCIPSLGVMGQRFVPVELLGERRYLATGVLSLARSTGAALIPLFCFRDRDGRWRLVLEAPIAVPAGGKGDADLAGTMAAYARLLEGYVRRHPEQWFSWLPDPAVKTLLDRAV
jgi:KDO2-lipid IV(A) lauroyltransferase